MSINWVGPLGRAATFRRVPHRGAHRRSAGTEKQSKEASVSKANFCKNFGPDLGSRLDLSRGGRDSDRVAFRGNGSYGRPNSTGSRRAAGYCPPAHRAGATAEKQTVAHVGRSWLRPDL